MTLDLPQPQVLMDYFDDPQYQWHMRLLLVGDGSGRWVASSPDLEVALVDLTAHRVIPLDRASSYPEAQVGNIYGFDPITPQELASPVRHGRQLARVIGFGASGRTEEDGRWLVSDPASDAYGEEILGPAQDDPESFVATERVGLVLLDGVWTVCEFMGAGKEESWRLDKATKAGRDKRIIGYIADDRGKKFVDERAAMERFKNEELEDFPFRGPRVTFEFLESIRSAGRSLTQHRQNGVLKSGVNATGGAAREHQTLTGALRWAIQYDQLDVTMLASMELLSRRVVQIESAVRRNPKLPDYAGLDIMMDTQTDATGGASSFSTWVAEQQKTVAKIAKQGRLLREEREAERRRVNKESGGKASAEG